jgi:hypothetical protein
MGAITSKIERAGRGSRRPGRRARVKERGGDGGGAKPNISIDRERYDERDGTPSHRTLIQRPLFIPPPRFDRQIAIVVLPVRFMLESTRCKLVVVI